MSYFLKTGDKLRIRFGRNPQPKTSSKGQKRLLGMDLASDFSAGPAFRIDASDRWSDASSTRRDRDGDDGRRRWPPSEPGDARPVSAAAAAGARDALSSTWALRAPVRGKAV